MKISMNWLSEYIDIPCTPEELSDIMTNLGLEVEGIEKKQNVEGGLEGLVVGKVVECIKHPNADRLSLTKVNIGGEHNLQIVCGAPNVASGQKVVIATVGTTLFPTDNESFSIKKGKIRGEISEGMICAEDEIGIGSDHSGIIVLPDELEIGSLVSSYYEVETDFVFDIGLTPNRSDATSHLGVARDLAAYFSFHNNKPWKINYPDVSQFQEKAGVRKIEVQVDDGEGCPRYTGISISNVKVQASPKWMQERLRSVDVRPINNIVDITNFVLHEYGQPLHAFDLNKIEKKTVLVKNLGSGSQFQSLDEEVRTLGEEDLMICDGQENGMCIAGVFGGLKSGVTDDTDEIFLESAHFSAIRIRKTSTAHNLRTDAARCFEKGTDPNGTVDALKRAVSLMIDLAEARISSEVIDIYPEVIQPLKVDVRISRINQLIGHEISKEDIGRILGALGMSYSLKGETYEVDVPTDKADVTREADVIEEILRIFGFNNVDTPDHIKTSIRVSERVDRTFTQNLISEFLVGKGFYEAMGLSLIESGLYKNDLEDYHEKLVYVNNTSNIHLDAMRPEMVMSMLSSVAHNHNRQQKNLSLFEFGNTYQSSPEGYSERYVCGLILTGYEEELSWLGEQRPADFFTLKRTIFEILDKLGMGKYQISELSDTRFDFGLRIHRGKNTIGLIGKIALPLMKVSDLKEDVYYGEFDIDALTIQLKKNSVVVEDVPRFPSIKRDLALIVDQSVRYSTIERIALKGGGRLVHSISLFDIYEDDKHVGKGKKSLGISMVFVDSEKSLRDSDVDRLINKIINAAQNELGATLR